MTREAIRPDGVAIPAAPYSSVVASGDLVVTSGQVPFDIDGNLVSDAFDDQARQTFENLGRCLEAAGCAFADVLKVNAYLADFADFPAFNRIYAEFFSDPFPARTTVGARLLGFRIEVDAIARRPARAP
jgi:2-iminobutanoate/2-iminopropanoate deaminase